MRLIAHRGNCCGPNPERENTETYICEALEAGFDVEVDVWYVDGLWLFGHDKPEKPKTQSVTFEDNILKNPRVWKHAKNADALEMLHREGLHPYFFHDRDAYTLTSNGIPWIFPGELSVAGGIQVLRESETRYSVKSYGVCSDWVSSLAHLLDSDKTYHFDVNTSEFQKKVSAYLKNSQPAPSNQIDKLRFKSGHGISPTLYEIYDMKHKINEIIDRINEKD